MYCLFLNFDMLCFIASIFPPRLLKRHFINNFSRKKIPKNTQYYILQLTKLTKQAMITNDTL